MNLGNREVLTWCHVQCSKRRRAWPSTTAAFCVLRTQAVSWHLNSCQLVLLQVACSLRCSRYTHFTILSCFHNDANVMWRRFGRAAQRTLFDALTRTASTLRCTAVVAAFALCIIAAAYVWTLLQPAPDSGLLSPTDNLAGRSYADIVGGSPIDAVITWVNGSDPVWLQLKTRTKRLSTGLPLCDPEFTNNASTGCVSGTDS